MRRKDLIKTIDGDEYDFFSAWRHVICHSRQHLKWVKRKYNKRARKEAKRRAEKRLVDWINYWSEHDIHYLLVDTDDIEEEHDEQT